MRVTAIIYCPYVTTCFLHGNDDYSPIAGKHVNNVCELRAGLESIVVCFTVDTRDDTVHGFSPPQLIMIRVHGTRVSIDIENCTLQYCNHPPSNGT